MEIIIKITPIYALKVIKPMAKNTRAILLFDFI